MKKHLSFAIAVLLVAMLACSETDPLLRMDYSGTKILSVQVIPPSGTGSFTLEVLYQTYTSSRTGKTPGDIYCNYVTPDTATMPVGSFRPSTREVDEWNSNMHALSFSVKQANGVIQPGAYIAGCTAYDPSAGSYSSPVTATFTVVAEEKAPTEPPVAPPQEPPKPPTITLTGGDAHVR